MEELLIIVISFIGRALAGLFLMVVESLVVPGVAELLSWVAVGAESLFRRRVKA